MAEFQALLTAKAEWKPHQIAKAGDIAKLADAATTLAETVKSALSLSRNGMAVVKLLATLQNINPLLTALDALADEVLKQIQDLKSAGYWMLYIDPYYDPNVTATEQYDYGLEQKRDEGGVRIWKKKDKTGQYQEVKNYEPNQGEIDSEKVKPAFVVPNKLIPGGYNHFNPLPDPLDNQSKYPQFTAAEVITEFVKAFDDEGDVPRYSKIDKPSLLPKKDDITKPFDDSEANLVWDVDGNPFRGWDPDKDFGLELFNIGKTHPDVESGLIKDYEASRKPLNTRVQKGKPSILGNTEFDGGSGAIAIIIGANNFDKFTSVFNEFSKMFTDIPELTPGITGRSLLDTFMSILDPAAVTLKVKNHDLKYKQFLKGDIVGGARYGSLGEIQSINAESFTTSVKTGEREVKTVDDLGNPLKKPDGTLIKVIEEYDMNPITEEYTKGRWVDLEMTVKPIRGIDGYNPWIPGDMINEMETRGKFGNSAATTAETGVDYYDNYVIVGQATWEGPKNQRIYPKTGMVQIETLTELPKSVPPDFSGILIDDVVPGWGEFFQELENFVKQIKGYISNSATFIQEMIDMIAEVEAFLQHLIDLIDKFLGFFRITLPSEGVYALYIPNQPDGNKGLQKQLKEAEGIPPLAYSSGILFVGTEGDKLIAGGGSKNPIDLLALVLGLLDSEEEETAAAGEGDDKSVEEKTADLSKALGQAAEGSDKDEWKDKPTEEKLGSMLLDRLL